MINYVIGISLGIDNFISLLLPYTYLHPIRLIALIAVGVVICNFREIDKIKFKIPLLILIGLFSWGLILSVTRYYFDYNEEGFIFLPIIRHSFAFILGIFLFLLFSIQRERYDLSKITEAIALTSLLPLSCGVYEIFSGQIVGKFPRIDSFFSEPSYFGDYLILILAPSILINLKTFNCLTYAKKTILVLVSILFVTNFFYMQSGTALLKSATFGAIGLFLYPGHRKIKSIVFIALTIVFYYLIFIDKGYINAIWAYFKVLWLSPKWFFHPDFYTIFDRFFSIYAAIKNFFTTEGLIGLGFGGDYYNFKKLFPSSMQEFLISIKPTHSYFNSFTSKTILYFGLPGSAFTLYTFFTCYKLRNPIIRICFLNILVTCLWGVSNFSLPYFWFWFAVALHSNKETIINE